MIKSTSRFIFCHCKLGFTTFFAISSFPYKPSPTTKHHSIFSNEHFNKQLVNLLKVSEDVPAALIADLSQMIAKEHKSVGIYLGLSNDKLNALDVEYPSVGERIIAMLNAWRDQMTKKATRSNLIKALVKVNRNDAAEKVARFREQLPNLARE